MMKLSLDRTGVRLTCASCGATNRHRYSALERATKCGRCKAALPFPSMPIDVPDTQLFDAAIGQSSVPIVVDFWAAWCAPCRMMAPEIEKLAQRTGGRALVLKVDTDALAELGQRYEIRSIPTIAVFKNGREATRTAGVQPASKIEQLLQQYAAA